MFYVDPSPVGGNNRAECDVAVGQETNLEEDGPRFTKRGGAALGLALSAPAAFAAPCDTGTMAPNAGQTAKTLNDGTSEAEPGSSSDVSPGEG